MEIHQQSIYIPLSETDALHMQRIYTHEGGKPIFLLHGSIENGKIFYSKSLKGLAPYLAQQGYDVFVGDMQGRGKSKPAISRNSKYGQVDVIKTDIPAFLNKIKEIKGDVPVHAMGHSWGGVLLLAFMSRFESNIISLVTFGAKRQITARNKEYYTLIYNWYVLGRILVALYGYLPAKKFKIGSDDEPKNHYKQINQWLLAKNGEWIDNADGFDYGKTLKEKTIAPSLFIAAQNDAVLGHPKDVKNLQNDIQASETEYWLLSKENGNLHNYDHINMLTHKDCSKDHFPKIVEWLKSKEVAN
jgi:predicted alpha/beta hydrolase